MYHKGTKYPLLITVVGRQPLCLRCGLRGHVRRDCSTPVCRNCSRYGHVTGTCNAKQPSYSSALACEKGCYRGVADNITEDEVAGERKEQLLKARQEQKERDRLNQEFFWWIG